MDTPKKTILVVDDEPDIADMLKTLLEEQYHVILAHDGFEALKALKKNPVELVILDLVMPKKSGLEVILDIKQYFPKLKIIVASGNPNQMGEASLLKVDLMFTKPIDVKSLCRAVNNILPPV